MPSRPPTSSAETPQPPAKQTNRASAISQRASRTIRFLDGAIFLFLGLFAVLLPHSIKGSQHAWQIACVLWLLKLLVARARPFPQPLAAPLLAYVVLSGISTMLSPDPYLSWDRMKIVCLLIVGIVVAQNLHKVSQVRTLIYLLILSGFAATIFVGWEYTYGVGVRVGFVQGTSALYRAHVYQDDIITEINGREVHTPAQLEQLVQQSPPASLLRIDLVRGYPFHKRQTYILREQFLQSGLGTPELRLSRGRPLKAQGTLGHYVDFAEMLMQIGCMTWAVLLGLDPRKRGLQLLLALTLAVLTAALLLTETRAALAGLALGGFLSVLLLAGKRVRIWATVALIVFLIAAALWIHHTRGSQALGGHDPGTTFRAMMWEDGFRLIRQHPWFGVGMETIRNHWMEWNIRAFTYFHDESHFHNDMIQIGVERGLPALAAWLWFVIAYVFFLIRLIFHALPRSRFAAAVATGVLSSFAALQLTAIVHYDLGIESVAMILFFYFGLAIALERLLQDPQAIDVP
jgi:O-antigen ligase